MQLCVVIDVIQSRHNASLSSRQQMTNAVVFSFILMDYLQLP